MVDPSYKDLFLDWLMDPKSDDNCDLSGYEDSEILEIVCELLRDWEVTAAGLTHKVQNKILWRIMSNPLFVGWSLAEVPLEKALSFIDAAKNVTLSIPTLFAPNEAMENAYYMWWDCLVDHETSSAVMDELLLTLSELSLHKDERIQAAALHGLGHLRHPRRAAAVDEFIRRHPDLAGNPWVLECREGTVM